MSQPITRAEHSAAAMGLSGDSVDRPWYLEATPLATLPWLIRLHWTTAAIEVMAAGVAWGFPQLNLPLDHVTVLLLTSVAAHLLVAWRLSTGRAVPPAVAAGSIAVETLLLSGLLEITGGPLNPFTVVYLVHITLAALTLGRMWAVGLAAFAAACYGVLVYWHTQELVPGHHTLHDFPTHLLTIWVSVGVTLELIAYFVVKVSEALAHRERELEAMRARAARNDRLAAITTLTAGAAHELSTPLATIALAARELERTAGTPQTGTLVEDARLIRHEVDRCRTILDQMSGRAGGTAADDSDFVNVENVIEDVRAHLRPEQLERLRVFLPADRLAIRASRAGLARAVLSLVNNAFDASDDEGLPVLVEVRQDNATLRVAVRDWGPGLSPEELDRVGEPFYTTKQPGRGLGLGLFLARIFAERFGGTLSLESQDGTTATLELPLRSDLVASS